MCNNPKSYGRVDCALVKDGVAECNIWSSYYADGGGGGQANIDGEH
jgi:hypothetical protein